MQLGCRTSSLAVGRKNVLLATWQFCLNMGTTYKSAWGNARLRQKYYSDHDYRAKRNARSLAWNKEKRKDPEYCLLTSAEASARQKQKRQNPDFCVQQAERSRERRRNPKHRAKYLAQLTRSSERRRLDPRLKITARLRARLRMYVLRCLNGKKSARTMELVHCDINALIAHLLKPFPVGTDIMALLKTHHIDHAIPCIAFDATLVEEQRICWHWSNLQLLPDVENHSKSAKWNLDDGHLQCGEVSKALIKQIQSRYKKTRWHRPDQQVAKAA